MKKFLKLTMAAAVLGLVWNFMPMDVQAQSAAVAEKVLRVKIAVLNLDGVRANSAAVKGIRTQLETYRKAIQGDIQREEEALRKANEELGRQRTILAPEAFDAERRKFEGRVAALQRKVQNSKQALDQTYGQAMGAVDKEMMNAITDVANANEITLLIRKSAVIMNATALDVSAAVLKRLDERLPSVTVAKPAPAGG